MRRAAASARRRRAPRSPRAGAAAGATRSGNFSVNHLDRVRVSRDRVDVHYILDQAEIPTFQERGRPPAQVLARKRARGRARRAR